MGRVIKIRLSIEERQELEALVGRPTEEAGLVRRARVILLSDRGVSGREIARRLESLARARIQGPDLVS